MAKTIVLRRNFPPMTVKEFINAAQYVSPSDRYARWVLMHMGLTGILQVQFAEFINQFPLYAEYDGKWWRVTDATQDGGVFLSKELGRSVGYDEYVSLIMITQWSRTS